MPPYRRDMPASFAASSKVGHDSVTSSGRCRLRRCKRPAARIRTAPPKILVPVNNLRILAALALNALWPDVSPANGGVRCSFGTRSPAIVCVPGRDLPMHNRPTGVEEPDRRHRAHVVEEPLAFPHGDAGVERSLPARRTSLRPDRPCAGHDATRVARVGSSVPAVCRRGPSARTARSPCADRRASRWSLTMSRAWCSNSLDPGVAGGGTKLVGVVRAKGVPARRREERLPGNGCHRSG